MYKWENTSLFFIWNRADIRPQLEGCVSPAWSAPYEFIQMFQSASPFYNKWNNSNMKIQITLFALSNVHILQQCMYTKSLFTSTCTCIRTLFTSTCIHFPHQHLLYFSHQHVHTHMFTLTFIWLKYCWYDIKQQIIYQSITMYTLFISECIHFYILVVYSSILVWYTVASPMDISVWVKNSWVGRKTPLINKRTKLRITLSSVTFQCFWFHCSVYLTFHCRDWLPVTTTVICTSQLHKHQLMWEPGQSQWNKGLMFSLEGKK